MKMAPEGSVIAGVATAALVYSIYAGFGPTVADKRVSSPGDLDLDSSERQATMLSAAVVSGVSLIARDPTIFVIGGATLVVLAWTHRTANYYDPVTRTVAGMFSGSTTAEG